MIGIGRSSRGERWLVAAGLALGFAAIVLVWSPFSGRARRLRATNAPSTGLSWQASGAPFRLTFMFDGRPLTSEPVPGRLTYLPASDGVVHTLTKLLASVKVAHGRRYLVSTDERGREAVVTVTRAATGLRVAFVLRPATGVRRVYEVLSASPTEQFLGAGEQSDFVDLRGQVVSLMVAYACGVEFPMPFFLSSAGYGVFLPTNRSGRLAFPGGGAGAPCLRGPNPDCPLRPAPDRTELCFDAGQLVYRLYAGTPNQIMRDYTADAGRPARASLEQFGGQKWRGMWRENTAQNLLGDALHYRRLGIPLSWVHINDPWEQNRCWGSFRYDHRRFPNPAKLVGRLHRLGIRVMLWVSPLVNLSPDCRRAGYSSRDLLGSNPSYAEVDFTDALAAHVFELRLRRALSVGVDGIKGDRGDEIDLTRLQLHSGAGNELQNAYPELFASAVTDAWPTTRSRDFSTIFRAGSLGSQARLPGIDLGDLPGTFAGLQTAIRRGLSAGVSGYPVWGSDIGGYSNATPPLSAELFVRWAQFGAVSPIFEVGGLGESSDFWQFGKRTVDLFRASAILHYELAPYLYQLSRQASATGTPILRPLGFDFPHDPRSWNSNLEFTLGPSLLVAPVAGPAGGRPGNTLAGPSVYLPPGDWIDLFSGFTLPGNETITRPTPLSQFPLYLRTGSAIPFNLRDPQLWSTPWPLDKLEPPGRGGWVYAPGLNPTRAHSPGFGDLTVRPKASTIVFTVTHAPKHLELLVLSHRLPAAVTIDGHAYPATTPARLKTAANGWTTSTAPYPGILLKLTVRGNDATATIQTG